MHLTCFKGYNGMTGHCKICFQTLPYDDASSSAVPPLATIYMNHSLTPLAARDIQYLL